jgi:hypothetical protein
LARAEEGIWPFFQVERPARIDVGSVRCHRKPALQPGDLMLEILPMDRNADAPKSVSPMTGDP